MKLVFATEASFFRGKDGNLYVPPHGTFTNRLMARYLEAFDSVSLLARVRNTPEEEYLPERRIGNDRISVLPLPYYSGPWQFLKKRSEIIRTIRSHIEPDTAYICRVPGTIGTTLARCLRERNIPYAVEVVGDPYDVFSPQSTKYFLRPLYRSKLTSDLKKTVYHSSAALFVTREYLQRRYHTRDGVFTTFASDVALTGETFVDKEKTWSGTSGNIKLISVGTLGQLYKAPDIVLKAIAQLKEKHHIICELTWVGGGRHQKEMQELTLSLGIEEQVNFLGHVEAGNGVRQRLDESDLFLLVSRTEGLPRALIEAMARGLPCITSRVGGVPELLDNSALVPANDVNALAEKIREFIETPGLAQEQAKRNLAVAREYTDDFLAEKRRIFYSEIIKAYH